MIRLEFWLSDDNVERLFAIKRKQGKNQMTGNEFAKELLEKELYRLHPKRVKIDECGNEEF